MNICIVEDNLALLENLRILLNGEPGFVVTGVHSSAESALAAMPWKDGELLLVDKAAIAVVAGAEEAAS